MKIFKYKGKLFNTWTAQIKRSGSVLFNYKLQIVIFASLFKKS